MLSALVRGAAARAGDQPAVVSDGGIVTWHDVADRAAALAAGLRAASIDRFACVVDDIAELVALLAASADAGAEACVYSRAIDPESVAELAATFDHRVVVTDRPTEVATGDTPVTRIAELAAGAAASGPAVPGAAADETGPEAAAPVLILTTGTTGRPKGARHDWARLAGAVREAPDGPDQRWLLAYNPNQFAGIQVLLHVLVNAATLVVPSSTQPAIAIDVMRAHGVTHASATPTFWRFATGLLDPATAQELPLRQITLGGEAVPGPLLDDLRDLFPDARISQVYASTEFGSSVSVRDGEHGLPLSVLERGEDAGVQFRIVDGQLHARSTVGMLGYHVADSQADTADDEGWRPTGDLVEVRDGRILFVGRVSEVINVGGVKVHPLPVEELVGSVAGVRLVHAYGRPNAMTGQILALDVVADTGVDADELEDAIRDVCADLPRAAQPRRIRFVDDVALKEGKVARGGSDP